MCDRTKLKTFLIRDDAPSLPVFFSLAPKVISASDWIFSILIHIMQMSGYVLMAKCSRIHVFKTFSDSLILLMHRESKGVNEKWEGKMKNGDDCTVGWINGFHFMHNKGRGWGWGGWWPLFMLVNALCATLLHSCQPSATKTTPLLSSAAKKGSGMIDCTVYALKLTSGTFVFCFDTFHAQNKLCKIKIPNNTLH